MCWEGLQFPRQILPFSDYTRPVFQLAYQPCATGLRCTLKALFLEWHTHQFAQDFPSFKTESRDSPTGLPGSQAHQDVDLPSCVPTPTWVWDPFAQDHEVFSAKWSPYSPMA